MLAAIVHRGPMKKEFSLLAHSRRFRRLSIIDLAGGSAHLE
jgi:asparagine synthetase B (glutamine-hydrolysing)